MTHKYPPQPYTQKLLDLGIIEFSYNYGDLNYDKQESINYRVTDNYKMFCNGEHYYNNLIRNFEEIYINGIFKNFSLFHDMTEDISFIDKLKDIDVYKKIEI